MQPTSDKLYHTCFTHLFSTYDLPPGVGRRAELGLFSELVPLAWNYAEGTGVLYVPDYAQDRHHLADAEWVERASLKGDIKVQYVSAKVWNEEIYPHSFVMGQ